MEINLRGPVFVRWIEQDLSVLLGRVNLLDDTIELFTLGSALFDRRLHEANGLTAWLGGGDEGLHDGVLHLKLQKPILKWSVADTEDNDFTDRTYAILKQWLKLERWNRRYFRAGVAREIKWETNKMPVDGEVIHTWSPARGREALADIEPLVHLIGLHALRHPELWTRVHAVEETLRGPNDPNMMAGMRPVQQLFDALSRLGVILRNHPTADAVATMQILCCDKEGANFWLHNYGRNSSGGSQRHEGTWEELKQKGFDWQFEGEGPNAKVGLSLVRYFASRPIPHEIIDGPEEVPSVRLGDHSPCLFLRRVPSDKPATDSKE